MNNFWEGKKVLVTGHTGFVGSWLSCVLQEKGACVTGFSLEEETGSLFEKIKDDLCIESLYGDLRDKESVISCMEKTQPEIVFHIAAFGFVKECFDDPERAYSSNVNGTLNILETIRKLKKPYRVIIASSDKVYRNSGMDEYLFNEYDPLGGSDPYSASKTCEDLLSQSYYETYLSDIGIGMSIVRPSNILGGGDHNINRLIPSIYYNLKGGGAPEIRNPSSTRPWQSILDIVDAYLTVAEKNQGECGIYNVGPDPIGIKTVGEIADYVCKLYGKEWTGAFCDGKLQEKKYLGLSIEKIERELGWKPKKTLEETLDDIFEFYNEDDGKNTYKLCMKQICRYYNILSK